MDKHFSAFQIPGPELRLTLSGCSFTLISLLIESRTPHSPRLRILARTEIGTIVELRGSVDPGFILEGLIDRPEKLLEPLEIEILDVEAGIDDNHNN